MKRRYIRLGSLAAAMICAASLLLPLGQIHAAGSQALQGQVPKTVTSHHLTPLHRLEATNRLQLAISLPLRDREGLSNLFNQIYDPNSPNYHHYLTSPQFTDRFGPSTNDYEALKACVHSNHIAITASHPNRALLDINGSVADIEKFLHVKMQVYQHPTENRTFFAPDTDPTIDTDVPLLHVHGLDNAVLPHPKLRKRDLANGTNGVGRGTGSGPLGTFQGYDFRNAYVPGVTLTGAGQSVALFELDGYFDSDIAAYISQTGLPNVPRVNVFLDGFTAGPLTSSGDGECTLDIDMAISMAPGLNSVVVYQGFIPQDILNRIATDNTCKQISCSWGWLPFDQASDQTFQQFGVQGQTFLSASGDDGAETTSDVIIPPSDDPYITQVGGTTLTTTGPLGSYVSEQVWSWFPGQEDASSGGISFIYPTPTWQQGVDMSGNGGSSSFRCYPDVALTADNIYIVADDGIPEPGFGGTSCAAPLWAGFIAMVNQQGAAGGTAPVGFINPAVYSIAKGSKYPLTFHDITVGNDTNLSSPLLFQATAGYDLCTGWGTPSGSNLINALAPVATTPVLTVLTNFVTGGNGNGIIDADECNNLSILLTNQANIIATGVQATLTSQTPGAIVAQGSALYPIIFPHGSGANLSFFTLSTQPTFVCGTPIVLTLVVKSDQVTQTNTIVLPSGVIGAPVSFGNNSAAVVPQNFLPLVSPVNVTNMPSVGKLTVSVNLSAQFDFGMVLQLTAPNGTNITLSANNGGLGANFGTACNSNSETIFDDSASNSVLTGSAPFVGSFTPQQPLSTFHLFSGTNLNGTWNLQVINDFSGTPAVLNCWSLNVYPEQCVDGGGECPGADLSLTMTAAPQQVTQNSNLIYTLTVSNAGPGTAGSVLIVQTLPAGVGFVTTTGDPATASQSGSNLNLTLGSIPVYGTATVSVVTIPTIPGQIISTATVGSSQPDGNLLNNTASATAFVTQPTADIGVSIRATPLTVVQGGTLTYTINVTNNGPNIAKSVVLVNTLPANANYISSTASQGTVSFNGTLANLGDIGPGTNVVVTVVITPNVTGTIVASTSASISALELDPITFNNSASVSTVVGPAADLRVTAIATPSPVIAGSNYSYIITITNAGPSAATGVSFSQSLPGGASFVSSTLAGAAVVNGNINAVIGTITNGTSITVTNVLTAPTLLQGVQTALLSSTITVSGSPDDPTPADATVTLQTIAEPPTITIVPAGATITSGSSNGAVGTSGSYLVQFALQNVGTIPTVNLTATLQANSGLQLPSGSQVYGTLIPGAAPTARQFSFIANSTNGGAIVANLVLQNNGSNIGTATFTFVMPVVQKFWNTNFISIPAAQFIPQPSSGPASPYPSPIVVSNIATNISAVTVTISNMVHTDPSDVGMLLISPTGQSCVLMSSAGGVAMNTPVTFTFDQSAALLLPSLGQIVSSSYRPADYNPSDAYPGAPIPVGPYNTNLSVFGSMPANGTWSLYVYDQANSDWGAISNGWGLTFTTVTPINPVADLLASISASTNQVILGNVISNVWTVTNNGPAAAAVYVTNILSAGLTLVSNNLPLGATIVQSGVTNIFNLGLLASGAGFGATNFVTASASGPQTNTIIAYSAVLDNNPGNNSASVVVTVNPPPADLAVGAIAISPNPVVVSSSVVYTLYVTNNGPSNAFSVTGFFTNAASIHVTSASSSQGSCTIATGSVQCNLGTIAVGQSASVTIVAIPVSTGTFTNSWSATTTCNDTNLSNNSITGQMSVILPVSIITNGPVALISQGSAPFNGAINSGQVNTVSFTLLNIGSGATTNLVATLLANSGITPITTSATYGTISAGGSGSQSFAFTANGNPGSIVKAAFSLHDGGNTNFGLVTFNFMIPTTQTFTNGGAIVIPDVGPAVPYPSVIQVSGLTNGSSDLLVTKVTATLNGFTHSFPRDVEAILVNPAGQEVVLMEHAGGAFSVTNLTLTFDDTATQLLSSNHTLAGGSYLESVYAPFDVFPGLDVVPANSTNLAFFNGTDANGLWTLYVYDDSPGNSGVIARGWTLGLTAVSTVNSAARLVVTTLESPNPAVGGDYVYYQVIVSNAGPSTAAGVVLTDTIPAGTVLGPGSVSLSQGTFGAVSNHVVCTFGTIPAGSLAVATIQIVADARGVLTNTAVATSTSADLYLPDATSVMIVPVFGNAAPVLSAAAVTGGGFQLTIQGLAGQNYSIQTSADLIHWTTVQTNTGTFNYLDTTTNAPARFYRAVQQPQ